MSRSLTLSLVGAVGAIIAVCCYAATDEQSSKKTTSQAPISITIEEDGAATGIATKNQVEKIYDVRKGELDKNFKEARNKRDAKELKLINLAYDSVDCMQKSVEHFPELIDVIDGKHMEANNVAEVMENNCVTDVLAHVKRDIPEDLDASEKIFKELGFTIPSDLDDFQ